MCGGCGCINISHRITSSFKASSHALLQCAAPKDGDDSLSPIAGASSPGLDASTRTGTSINDADDGKVLKEISGGGTAGQ